MVHQASHCYVVLPDSCFLLSLYILFVSVYKFLSQELSVGKMPVLFQLFNAFFLNDSFQNFFTSSLVFQKGLFLYELLYAIDRRLVDSVSVPELLIRLFGFVRAFLGSNLRPLTSKVVSYNLSLVVTHDISKNLRLFEV